MPNMRYLTVLASEALNCIALFVDRIGGIVAASPVVEFGIGSMTPQVLLWSFELRGEVQELPERAWRRLFAFNDRGEMDRRTDLACLEGMFRAGRYY